jgi:hypothetical protein
MFPLCQQLVRTMHQITPLLMEPTMLMLFHHQFQYQNMKALLGNSQNLFSNTAHQIDIRLVMLMAWA